MESTQHLLGDALHHATVVVGDLRAAARNYAELLGIFQWQVFHASAENIGETAAYGSTTPFTYATAVGANQHGVTFRLVQPVDGFSSFTELLLTRGPSIHSICTGVLSPGQMTALRLAPACRDLADLQAETVDGVVRRVYLDTRAALGGFAVELLVPLTADWDTAPKPDELWDLQAEVQPPEEAQVLHQVPKIGHFGVAVLQLTARLPGFARLLGLSHWSGVHFSSLPNGALEQSTLNGQEVRHSFLLATAAASNFGFEVLQALAGPTHYREGFIDRVGEGIHHLLLLPGLTEQQWLQLRNWMTGLGVPVAMSGRVRGGSAEFFYLDTRERLGFLIECIVRYPGKPAAPPPLPSQGRFTFDFPDLPGQSRDGQG